MTEILAHPRVLIFGAGAVGSLLGGVLSSGGYDVTLLGSGPEIDAIQQRGLSLTLHNQRSQVYPTAISSIDEIREAFDIVLLTVRAYAVKDALASLPSLLKDEGVLVSLQNGIGVEEQIQQTLPAVRLVAGSLTLSADAAEPGYASSSSRSGGVSFAPVSSGAPAADITEMFRRCGIPASTLDDYRSMKWTKLLLNQMANGIPAILDWTPGQLYRNPDAFNVEHALLRETLVVISADDARLVSLPGFPAPLLGWALALPPSIARRLLLRRVEGGRGEKLPSLLLDLQAGRTKLESEWLYGAVARTGERYGIQTPANRRVNRILLSIAVNEELRRAFRNDPGRLSRNVQLAGRNLSLGSGRQNGVS